MAEGMQINKGGRPLHRALRQIRYCPRSGRPFSRPRRIVASRCISPSSPMTPSYVSAAVGRHRSPIPPPSADLRVPVPQFPLPFVQANALGDMTKFSRHTYVPLRTPETYRAGHVQHEAPWRLGRLSCPPLTDSSSLVSSPDPGAYARLWFFFCFLLASASASGPERSYQTPDDQGLTKRRDKKEGPINDPQSTPIASSIAFPGRGTEEPSTYRLRLKKPLPSG